MPSRPAFRRAFCEFAMTVEFPSHGDELPLTLIVFAFNEAENVPVVLPEIRAWLRGRRGAYQLVFVDDGSTDATRERALAVCDGDTRCSVISHPRNRGIGAALKTGVRAA